MYVIVKFLYNHVSGHVLAHTCIYILTLSDSTWVCTYTLALQLTYNLFIDALTYIAKCGTHIDIVYLHNIRIFIYIHVYKFIYCILYLHMHLYRHLRAIWYVLSFVYRVYIIIYIIIYIHREREIECCKYCHCQKAMIGMNMHELPWRHTGAPSRRVVIPLIALQAPTNLDLWIGEEVSKLFHVT